MIDININVVAHELDPTKQYVVEVRRGDLPYEAVEKLSRGLKDQFGINNVVVLSETGEAVKVKELPEGGK